MIMGRGTDDDILRVFWDFDHLFSKDQMPGVL